MPISSRLILDEFDARILGKPVFKLHIHDGAIDLAELKQEMDAVSHPTMICCFAPHQTKLLSFLQEENFRLITTRNTYRKTISNEAEAYVIPDGMHAIGKGDPGLAGPGTGYDDLLAEIVPKSRFSKDPMIPAAQALEAYRQWLANSLWDGFADECFVVDTGGRHAGLITLKVRESSGFIDLVVVNREFQGKRIGKVLLSLAEKYMAGRGITVMKVETEGENIQSNAFYQRNAFVLEKFELIFHRHF